MRAACAERVATTPAQSAEERRLQASIEYAMELEETRLRELLRLDREQLWTLLTRHRRWRGRLQFLWNEMNTPVVAIKQSFMRAEACLDSIQASQKQAEEHQPDISDSNGTDAILRILFASVSSNHRSRISETLTLLEQPERKGPADAALEIAKRQLLAALALLTDRSTGCPSKCRRHLTHVSCSRAAIGTIVGKGGANIKRIGAQFGCTVVFCPKMQCFRVDGDAEATQKVEVELINLEKKFHRDQAHWAKEKARRSAEKKLSRDFSKQLHEDLDFPEPQNFKEEVAGLWHRHQRGRKKAAKRRCQKITIDNTTASTAPGGRRSKPTQLDGAGARALKRVLRSQTAYKSKRPARGANSFAQIHMQMHVQVQPKVSEEPKACSRRCWKPKLWRPVAQKKTRPIVKKKKKAASESAVALFQPTISLDCATQQQWDLLASSRRWRGLVQELINLLRPRFAGDAPFALKQSFLLCSNEPTSPTPRSTNLPEKTEAALLRLLAPTKPKGVAIGTAAEAAQSDRELASRLRLARAVELLMGDLGQIKVMRTQMASPLQAQPDPEPVIESEQKPCSELCGAPAAA